MKINHYKIFSSLVLLSALGGATTSFAQGLKRKVLFIGNSYTASHTLPNLVRDAATSVGDTLVTEFVAPGGFTLELHASDVATRAKIDIGDWNYVVLQEQSQRPAFTDAEVATDVYPYAKKLDSLVHDKNKCARTVFFQTWGYRNGDLANCPIFPPLCTYKGMDSLLELRYQQMAIDNEALLAPVGLVFREIRAAYPSINLYEPDDSHPTLQGSYAAAITFYTILFGKNPNLVTFNPGLPPAEANQIRQVVLTNVFSKIAKFGVGKYNPDAAFTYATSGPNKMDFNSSSSLNAVNYNWNFGDGGTSVVANPSHTYATSGTYTVRLIVDDCLVKDTTTQTVIVPITGSINNLSPLNLVSIYPNPVQSILNIESPIANQKLSLSIVNFIGSVVMPTTILQNKAISVAHLPTGIYLLNITDQETGETITRKFVKD